MEIVTPSLWVDTAPQRWSSELNHSPFSFHICGWRKIFRGTPQETKMNEVIALKPDKDREFQVGDLVEVGDIVPDLSRELQEKHKKPW